jgi:hypothetical protein
VSLAVSLAGTTWVQKRVSIKMLMAGATGGAAMTASGVGGVRRSVGQVPSLVGTHSLALGVSCRYLRTYDFQTGRDNPLISIRRAGGVGTNTVGATGAIYGTTAAMQGRNPSMPEQPGEDVVQ